MKNSPKPPVAIKIPKKLEIHDDVRIDPYYWMKDRENPEVVDYLQQENAYNDRMTAHTKAFQKELFDEMKARIKLDDESVPYFKNGYWYYVRFLQDGDYPLFCRKKESLEATEKILFDANKMAEGHSFFNLGGINVSLDNELASFGVDTVSRRNYTLRIKNLKTDEIYPDTIENTTGRVAWANNNRTFFYVKRDPETLRPYQVYKHVLGTPVSQDELVYEEKDDTFSLSVYKSKSDAYIFISTGSTLSDEYWFLDAGKPEGEFNLFQPRIRGLEFDIEHFEDHFYILTNADQATNFKLEKTPVTATEKQHWEEVIPHRKNVLLEDVEIFKEYLVLTERTTGLSKIRIMRWDGTNDYYLPIESETYTAGTGRNSEFDTEILRYVFSDMTAPTQILDYNMRTGEQKLRKEQEILDPNFDRTNYYAKRLWAKAEDGKRVPISLVYKKGIQLDGTNPLLLYAYGSYGITIDPIFSPNRLSLLDRGFVYAIAHVRGGEYLGRTWYDDGKLLTKMNTFTDFIACSKHLIQQKYTSPKHLYAMGGSAGGMLMGGVLNLAPQLYNGVIAAVPFVDVVTTMLDDSIPLTTGEYDEWGNPNQKEFYAVMKAYSPYDNVVAKDYPHILVTTGFHDSQVQYWEPAKWVAKLRDLKTDQNKLLFHINMEAGHGGASGRFESLKELAEEFAFLLDLENKIN